MSETYADRAVRLAREHADGYYVNRVCPDCGISSMICGRVQCYCYNCHRHFDIDEVNE